MKKRFARFFGVWLVISGLLNVYLYGALSNWHWGAWSEGDIGSEAPVLSYVIGTAIQWGLLMTLGFWVVVLTLRRSHPTPRP
jgi:hypothetical protein